MPVSGDPRRRAALRWIAQRIGACTGFVPPPNLRFLECMRQILGLAEQDVIGAVRRHCHGGARALDVGANVGYVTRRLCRAVQPSGHVDAFEPTPLCLPVLRRNTAAFTNVTVHPIAVARTGGEVAFYSDAETHPNNSLYPTREGQAVIRVPASTLDAWYEANGSPRIDFVKIDVEGAEIDVLEGARDMIAGNPQITLVVEFCPKNLVAAGRSPNELFDCVASLGLEAALLSESGETKLDVAGAESVVLNRDGYRNVLLRTSGAGSPRPR